MKDGCLYLFIYILVGCGVKMERGSVVHNASISMINVLTEVTMKVTSFWNVTPYSLVKFTDVADESCMHLQCRRVRHSINQQGEPHVEN
jgi:hypothetical protein